MDATDKTAERLVEWFRNHAKEHGIRVYDDDGASIGVHGHIPICKLVAFLLHGNATHTPGPPPAQSHHEMVQAALQNLPEGLADIKGPEETVP
jgi:hypothetical protein